MQKYFFSFIVWATVLSFFDLNSCPKDSYSSKTFLSTQPAYHNVAANYSGFDTLFFDRDLKYAIRTTAFHQDIFETQKMNSFFLMKNKDELLISKDGDILPLSLGLPDDFSGKLKIDPKHHQCGALLEGRYLIGELLQDSFVGNFCQNMWVCFKLPVVFIKNNLRASQLDVENAKDNKDGQAFDVLSSFDNSSLKYGKFSNSDMKKTSLSEISLGFGSTFIGSESSNSYLATSSSISIPIEKESDPEYIFSPNSGTNGHFCASWTVNSKLCLSEDDDKIKLNLFLNLENSFIIRKHQMRTFDLKNKPFSRFLQLRKKDQIDDLTESAANILTQNVRVSPYSVVDATFGIKANYNSLETELGFGVWAHPAERIKMEKTQFEEIYGISGSKINKSSSQSNISQKAPDDLKFTTIKFDDIDFASGASPATILYRFHSAINFVKQLETKDAFAGLGAFVEIPHNTTTAFYSYGSWASVGYAF